MKLDNSDPIARVMGNSKGCRRQGSSSSLVLSGETEEEHQNP